MAKQIMKYRKMNESRFSQIKAALVDHEVADIVKFYSQHPRTILRVKECKTYEDYRGKFVERRKPTQPKLVEEHDFRHALATRKDIESLVGLLGSMATQIEQLRKIIVDGLTAQVPASFTVDTSTIDDAPKKRGLFRR